LLIPALIFAATYAIVALGGLSLILSTLAASA